MPEFKEPLPGGSPVETQEHPPPNYEYSCISFGSKCT